MIVICGPFNQCNTIASDDFRKHYGVILQRKKLKSSLFLGLNIPVLKFIQDGYHCF